MVVAASELEVFETGGKPEVVEPEVVKTGDLSHTVRAAFTSVRSGKNSIALLIGPTMT